jgi:GT2 family glycosyltransferase
VSGVIGVSASVLGRFSAFTECLANLEKPPGTQVIFKTGIDISINRRDIVREALKQNAEWVWFVDDDMVFRSGHLHRLLSHDKPIVASLYLNRKPPLYPVAFNERLFDNGVVTWKPVVLGDAPADALADIVAAGTGGLLVKREVFEAIEYDTWFDHDEGTEDLPFCFRAYTAGFSLYLDLGAPMGHISTYTVWPGREEGQWNAEFVVDDKHCIVVELGE